MLDNGPLAGCFFNRKQGLSGHPAVIDGFVPCGAPGSLPDNDIDTVVPQVLCLSRTLYPVSENRHGFFVEKFPGLFQREFVNGDDLFYNAAKIDFCHVILLCFFMGYINLTSAHDKAR